MDRFKPIFVIDDMSADRDLLAGAVRAWRPEARVRTFGYLEDSYRQILDERPSAVVLDDFLGHLNALDTVKLMARMQMWGRIIVVAGTCQPARGALLKREGAFAYLSKRDIQADARVLGNVLADLEAASAAATVRLGTPSIFETIPELRNLPPLHPVSKSARA